MKFRIERLSPDGSSYPNATKNKSAWKLAVEAPSMEAAAKFAALTWEANAIGLLDYPVYMRLKWPGDSMFVAVEREVDISYHVRMA